MKILYLHQYFNFPSGNGSTRSYDLSRKFTEAGNQVTLITSSAFIKGNFKKRWTVMEKDNLKLHILKSDYSNKMAFSKRIIEFIRFMIFASFKSVRIKADIVIATSTPLSIGIPALFKKILTGVPYIFEVRDVWPDIPIAMGIIKNNLVIYLLYSIEKLFYRKAIKIVALSTDMAMLINNKGIVKKKIEVIPNISDINKFNKIRTCSIFEEHGIDTKNKKIVLYAGTIGFVNGVSYMVELAFEFKKEQENKIVFIIIGTGAEKDKIISLAKKYQVLNNNLFILDPIAKEELPSVYNESTVASSWVIDIQDLWANSANKYFDALAASKPIIINHGGWQAEEICKESIGMVLNTSPKIGANQLKKYLNNDLELKMHGENANKIALSKYSLEVAAEKYLNIIKELN